MYLRNERRSARRQHIGIGNHGECVHRYSHHDDDKGERAVLGILWARPQAEEGFCKEYHEYCCRSNDEEDALLRLSVEVAQLLMSTGRMEAYQRWEHRLGDGRCNNRQYRANRASARAWGD